MPESDENPGSIQETPLDAPVTLPQKVLVKLQEIQNELSNTGWKQLAKEMRFSGGRDNMLADLDKEDAEAGKMRSEQARRNEKLTRIGKVMEAQCPKAYEIVCAIGKTINTEAYGVEGSKDEQLLAGLRAVAATKNAKEPKTWKEKTWDKFCKFCTAAFYAIKTAVAPTLSAVGDDLEASAGAALRTVAHAGQGAVQQVVNAGKGYVQQVVEDGQRAVQDVLSYVPGAQNPAQEATPLTHVQQETLRRASEVSQGQGRSRSDSTGSTSSTGSA
jgi:hypothetical protein